MWAAMAVFVFGCEQTEETGMSEAAYPDIGIGCSLVRSSADEWTVSCPSPDIDGAMDPVIPDAGAPPPDAAPPPPDATPMEPDAAPPVPDAAPPAPDAAAPEPDAAPPELDAGPVVCEPALTLTARSTAAQPYNLIQLMAEGGTGAWHFELVEDNSGALVNARTGAYLAGTELGTTDRIRLTDTGCEGQAEFSIRVVSQMQVTPTVPLVEPEGGFTVAVSEGSGSFEFELVRDESGASLEGAEYRAGPELGSDMIRVEDMETGQRETIVITIVPDVQIEASPAVLYIPTGSSAKLNVQGGTGVYELEHPPALQSDGWRVWSDTPGTYAVTVHDRFSDETTSMTVSIVASLRGETDPINDFHMSNRIVNAGDLNGDGVDDFVIGRGQSDGAADNGGGVFVFLSEDGGFPAEASQQFLGTNRDDRLGRGLAVADINGDSLPDLIYGGRFLDLGSINSGGVMIHLGQPGGLFDEAPSTVIAGSQNDAQSGTSIAVCDFNGDGRPDIAIGAMSLEDRETQPVQYNQGAVTIHLGYEDGFLNRPDAVSLGVRPTENGEWVAQSMELGHELVAADFNGDGLCDVAVTAISWNFRQRNGTVYVYAGQAPTELSPGGVTSEPVIWYTTSEEPDETRRFGHRLAAGDLDGDGAAELIVGQPEYRVENPWLGGVAVFAGGDFPAPGTPTMQTLDDAVWRHTGNNWDQFGYDVSVADVNDDGRPDLVTTAMYSDAPDGRWDAGHIYVFTTDDAGALSAEPMLQVEGVEAARQMGESARYLGDVNGDGAPDFVTYSNRGGTDWFHVGRPLLMLSGEEGTYAETPLNMPWTATAGRFGWGVSLPGDVNGDGFQDAFVTSPHASYDAVFAGKVFFYPGTENGLDPEAQLLPRFAEHTAWDFVKKVEGVGDFDGDGHRDFVVLISHDERPDPLGERFAAPDGACPARVNDQGGAYIFLGGPEKFDLEPDFVFWGSGAGDAPEIISGDYDFNGDGLKDFAIGNHRRDVAAGGDGGSMMVVTGRPDPTPDQITVICEPFSQISGPLGRYQLGFSAAMMDDINGDGCDEVAIGVRLDETNGLRNQGAVYILYGHGGESCFAEQHVVRIARGQPWGQMGWSITTGDVDDDGLTDIAVGTPYELVAEARRGAVWIIPGTTLETYEPLPVAADQEREPFWIENVDAQWLIPGVEQNGEAGRGVQIIGGLVAMASLREFVDDTPEVGTVRLYRTGPDGGMAGEPVAILVGETARPGSQLGESMSASPDGTKLLVGAFRGSGNGRDNGSAYLLDLSILSP